MSNRATDLIRQEIQAMSTYVVPNATGMIKLDAMENPFEWPKAMVEEWLACLAGASPNRYPDPEAKALVEEIRRCFGVPEPAEVMLGNGSDELIQMVLMALAGGGQAVMSPEPSFVMYRQIAIALGLNYVAVPLQEDLSLDLSAMLEAIRAHQPAVIFLAYPNNPTGNLFDRHAVEQIIEAAPGWVVIDEAYEPFAGDSFMSSAGQPDKLMVMRTVSKLGLAGLRLGYLVGQPELMAELNKIRLPYNINCLSQLTVKFALEHYPVLKAQTEEICVQRSQLSCALSALDNLKVYPSDANFILFRLLARPSEPVFQGLKDQGVLIKHLGAGEGPLKNCLRVTVGSVTENQKFLAALKKVLAC